MNNIYIPKFKAKAFSSYLYAGENNENYTDYSIYQTSDAIFGDN
jgi:hypothetical protein